MTGCPQCFDLVASRSWDTRTPSRCPSQLRSGHHGEYQSIWAEPPSPSQEGVSRPCGRGRAGPVGGAQRHSLFRASLVAQMVKNPPVIRMTWVRSLGWEDPVEEDAATHSSILAWRLPIERGAWWATVHRVAQSWTRLKRFSTHACTSLHTCSRRVCEYFQRRTRPGIIDFHSLCA